MWILIIIAAIVLLIYFKNHKSGSGIKGWSGGDYVSLNNNSPDKLSGMIGSSFVSLKKSSDKWTGWIGGNYVSLTENNNGELSGWIGGSFTKT